MPLLPPPPSHSWHRSCGAFQDKQGREEEQERLWVLGVERKKPFGSDGGVEAYQKMLQQEDGQKKKDFGQSSLPEANALISENNELLGEELDDYENQE
nr:uncharacterized protein LOC109187064 [Ipomoea batatas]